MIRVLLVNLGEAPKTKTLMATTPDQLSSLLGAEQLPAMPHSALSVLQLGNDPTKVNLDDLVRPIEADPGLAVQVLKFFNSAYFGFQGKITNVRQGVALVGIRVVKNFVLWKAVFSLIPKATAPDFNVADLWQDALRRGMMARFLSLHIKMGDGDIAFAGTLLSDMAIPLLLKKMPDEYGAVLTRAAQNPKARLSKFEQEAFGWTHAEAAGVLGRFWKLPDSLITVVANHLNTDILDEGFVRGKVEQQVAVLVSFLPMASRAEWVERDTFLDLFEGLVGGAPSELKTLFAKVDAEYEQYAAILALAQPKKMLVEWLS